MRRARFCVEFPAMSTGMRAERAQARASRVTGHASASMRRVGRGVLPKVRSIRMNGLLASAHRCEVRASSVEAASSTVRNHPLCFDSAVGPFGGTASLSLS